MMLYSRHYDPTCALPDEELADRYYRCEECSEDFKESDGFCHEVPCEHCGGQLNFLGVF